ncbi:MAG: hypothetical protein AABZ53_02415 [Planctomycetota bacterium]
MRRWVIVIACAALLTTSVVAQPIAPAPGTPAKPAKGVKQEARVVRITGGLDCQLVATRLIEAADVAERARAPVLVIVLEGVRSYREDVVRDAIVRFKTLPIPIVVWDETPVDAKLHATHVCRGVAMLMLAAGTGGSRAPLTISTDEPDTRTVPAKVDAALVRADLREVLGLSAARRVKPPEAIDLLVGSKERLWWVARAPGTGTGVGGASAEWRIVATSEAPTPEAGGEVRELTAGVPTPEKEVRSGVLGPGDVRAFYGTLVRPDAESMLVKYNAKMPVRPHSNAMGGVDRLADAIRAEYEQLKQALAAGTRKERTPGEVIKEAERVARGVDAIDERLVHYPEIAMLTPPDGVEAGAKPGTNATEWRGKLKALKDRANKALEKAKAK